MFGPGLHRLLDQPYPLEPCGFQLFRGDMSRIGTVMDEACSNMKAMRTYLINAAILGAFVSLTACSEAPNNADQMEQKVDKAMEDLRAGKEEVSNDLRDLREKLVVEHARAEERLKDPALTPEQRTEWEAYKTDVQTQLDRVDGDLDNVGSATSEVWEDVKAGTRRTVDDVDDWFERQAEKVDRKTEADKDQDGH